MSLRGCFYLSSFFASKAFAFGAQFVTPTRAISLSSLVFNVPLRQRFLSQRSQTSPQVSLMGLCSPSVQVKSRRRGFPLLFRLGHRSSVKCFRVLFPWTCSTQVQIAILTLIQNNCLANLQYDNSRRQGMIGDLQLSEELQSLLDETCKTLVAGAISELQINRLKDLNAPTSIFIVENIKKTFEQFLFKNMDDRLLEQEEEKDILHENPSIEDPHLRMQTNVGELDGFSPIRFDHFSHSHQEQERMSDTLFGTSRKQNVGGEHSQPEPEKEKKLELQNSQLEPLIGHGQEGSNSLQFSSNPFTLSLSATNSLQLSSNPFTLSSSATNNETGAFSMDLTNQESTASLDEKKQ